jgi:hypothetical protein
MKTKLIAAVLLSSLLDSSLEAATVVSNLANAPNGSQGVLAEPHIPVFPGPYIDRQSLAQSFTTGTNLLQLGVITIEFVGGLGGGGFHASLHVDAAGVPSETPLAPLAGDDNPNRSGLIGYSPTAPIMLLPDTKYWVVAATDFVPPRSEYDLAVTQDQTETGFPGWSLGNSFFARQINGNVDSGWVDSGGSGALKISIAAVPEPSEVASSLAGAICSICVRAYRRRRR